MQSRGKRGDADAVLGEGGGLFAAVCGSQPDTSYGLTLEAWKSWEAGKMRRGGSSQSTGRGGGRFVWGGVDRGR